MSPDKQKLKQNVCSYTLYDIYVKKKSQMKVIWNEYAFVMMVLYKLEIFYLDTWLFVIFLCL